MAKVIQAKAVLSAEDRGASAVFDKLSKKIDQVGRAGKAATVVDQMARSIERAKTQMTAIDKFNASRGGFVDARARYQATQAAVTQAAAAMKRGNGDAQQLARSYERAQAAASSAAHAFERQKSALIANKRALEQMGIPASQAARYQERLRAEVDRTTAAIRRQEVASERSHNRRLAVAGAAAYAGHLAAHGVRHGAAETLHTYREFDKERRFGKAVMGLTDEQQKPLVDQAIHMGATTKFNDIQVLEAQRELAARGLKTDQVMGLMSPAGNLGMALDLRLPEAVKQMEGAIFGFKKDISTLDAAKASAQRTADVQVKAAKISGMTPEDITQAYKYGATPARLSGISEETLLAFAGISKKANMGGDESGVAFRALMAAAQSPTRGAREALLANGLNFKNYQKNPDKLALSPFVENVAAQYGVKLNDKAQAGLGRIFENKELISDPAKFTPAVMKVLGDTLGGSDAKSKRSIAGMANRFRASSMEGIDVNAFIADLMTKIPGNLQLANAIFGPKQGGRIATALGDPETFKKMIHELTGGSEGYAQKIADERMAGFDGAVSRFEGAIKNLETAIGRGFDADGKGGFLTGVTDFLAKGTQWFAERDPKVVATGAAGVGAAGLGLAGFATYKFLNILTTGGGLTASAVALDGSAAALTAAAARLGVGGVAGSVASGAAGAGSAAAAGGGAAAATAAKAAGGSIWKTIGTALPLVGVGAAAYLAAEGANDAQGITRDSERGRRKKQAAKYNWWGKYDPDGADERMNIVKAEVPRPSFIAPEIAPSIAFNLPPADGFPDVPHGGRRKRKTALPLLAQVPAGFFPGEPEQPAHSRGVGRGKPLMDRLSTAFATPSLSPSMTYGTGLGRDAGPVTATLVGSAEVSGEAEVKVVVEAGSALLQVVEQAKRINMDLRGSLNANGPGSAGKSSPDAAAPATGASGAW